MLLLLEKEWHRGNRSHSNDEVLEKLNRVIDVLSSGLPQSEIDGGWTEKARSVWLPIFADYREKYIEGRPPIDLNLVRGLDFAGVVGGELFELAAQIFASVRRLYS